jgi:hypothetical protein
MCFFDLCCKPVENKKKIYWEDELTAINEQFNIIRSNTHAKMREIEKKNKERKDLKEHKHHNTNHNKKRFF